MWFSVPFFIFPLPRCILLLEDLDAAFTRGISRDSTSTGAPTAPTKAAAEANDGSTLSLSGLLNSLDGVAAAEGRCVSVSLLHHSRRLIASFTISDTVFYSPRPITSSALIPL